MIQCGRTGSPPVNTYCVVTMVTGTHVCLFLLQHIVMIILVAMTTVTRVNVGGRRTRMTRFSTVRMSPVSPVRTKVNNRIVTTKVKNGN